MRLVWQFLAVMVITLVGGLAMVAFEDRQWAALATGLATAVLSVIVYRWIVRLTERRAVTELGRDGAVVKTGWGTLFGMVLFGLVILNIAFLGHYKVDGIGDPEAMIGLLGFMAAAAVTEELLFRGVLFRIMEQWSGTWIALAVTSVLFGGIHLINPNASLWGALAIAIEAGGMLGAAYIATRNLWVPIGIHFGWNIAASAIFSTEVSGNGTPQGLLDAATSGPTLVSGGDFGPEGSLYAVVFGIVTTVVFLWLAKRRGRLVPFRRAARAEAVARLPR
ncbi:CPBP family intramembrane metalloprotease [Glycomyces sp. TRM65418]|uniref:CPBP family intramembrane glutamic endopeptidase n=1 Tax=Glycomyces sp. TRM65418 TaxID=2867006 RepID=UPI001CE6885E|nr:CPBP family intramembrane glutamic endopeptidase [Glycomyces sp. TRM65418]MCC3761467.1 CPBP family intramembrane metalloprotease [Glycomyces sp. TRM65418]QZD55567.1 CPBP family intramembrane metalloprotease [Glycomyces sp. TRM65418]